MEEELAAWCRRWLGASPAGVLFRSGYLSEVTGLRLADGRDVVVKARPPATRLAGCLAVQATLAATAEELIPGGELLAPGPEAAGRFAALLAELVRLAPGPWASSSPPGMSASAVAASPPSGAGPASGRGQGKPAPARAACTARQPASRTAGGRALTTTPRPSASRSPVTWDR